MVRLNENATLKGFQFHLLLVVDHCSNGTKKGCPEFLLNQLFSNFLHSGLCYSLKMTGSYHLF